MLKLSCSEREVPPDGHRYVFGDGTIISQSCRSDWFDKIRQHYEMNSIPMPDNWRAIAEDQLCRVLPPGWCQRQSDTDPMDFIDTRITAGDIYRGMVAMTHLVLNGEDDLVSPAEAETRARDCAACFANINVAGCLPCMGVSNLIMNVIGPKRETSADPSLRQCAICKCAARSIVHVKAEVLAKGTSEYQYQQYQMVGPDNCWKAKGLKELREAGKF